MAIEKFSLREQILIFIVFATLIGGAYGLFRFAPENKRINELSAKLEANKNKVKNPAIVEAPLEDADDLQDSLSKLETELLELKTSLEDSEKSLAPVDSQETVLKISEAAREAGIRVVQSVPYIVIKENDKSTQLQTRSKGVSRRLAKKGLSRGSTSPIVGEMPKEGELVYRLVNHLKSPRPFQQVSIEGNFLNLYKFIQILKNLPWQTTIVKIDINAGFQTPPPGVAQPITAKILIAM